MEGKKGGCGYKDTESRRKGRGVGVRVEAQEKHREVKGGRKRW